MNALSPWIHIFLAVFVYIFFALSASFVAQKACGDLKEMEGRSSQLFLVLGAIANLCVLAITIMLLRFLDGRPVSSLGLTFSSRDLNFSLIATAAIFAFKDLHRAAYRVSYTIVLVAMLVAFYGPDIKII